MRTDNRMTKKGRSSALRTEAQKEELRPERGRGQGEVSSRKSAHRRLQHKFPREGPLPQGIVTSGRDMLRQAPSREEPERDGGRERGRAGTGKVWLMQIALGPPFNQMDETAHDGKKCKDLMVMFGWGRGFAHNLKGLSKTTRS